MNNSARPLQVGISAHLLAGESGYRSAGIHQYIHHLLSYLPKANCNVTAFLGPHSQWTGGSCTVRRSNWPTVNPLVRAVWEQLIQPGALKRTRVEIAHGPAFVGPLFAQCPFVVTVHDLSFLRFPHLFRPANRLYLSVFGRASVRRAKRIIAVSSHAAEETSELLGACPEEIEVIHHGVDARFHPLPPATVEEYRSRRGLPEGFLLFVGTLEPRKNLVRLVEAFDRADRKGFKLVLAGGQGWYYSEIANRVAELGLENEVVMLGFVPEEELPMLYNAATAFVYPSIYEGFGMPLLESMACGTPTLTSDCSAMPEACGDAGLVVDPYNVDSIATGLQLLLDDEGLRQSLRQRGIAHAADFTWDRMAHETAAVYRQVLDRERSE